MSETLRTFLESLKQSGKILTVDREVDPQFELNAVVRKIQSEMNLPVIFNRVRGTRYKVVSNGLGNYDIIASLIGEQRSGVARRWGQLTSSMSSQELPEFPSAAAEYEEISLDDVPHIIDRPGAS